MEFAVMEWLCNHPPILILLLVVMLIGFCLWLFGPITWQQREGSPQDDADEVRRWWRILRWLR